MSLETVAEDIRTEARERAEEIRAEAEAEAEDIVAAAEEAAEETLAEAEREAEEDVTAEREQALSGAKLEAKQRRLEARRDALESVRESVEETVRDLDGEDRRELTAALIAAAAEEFDEGEVRVYGRGDDADLIEELLADYDGFEYAGEYDCMGGVVCESDASRVRVNNTFDSVLETVWDEELREVSAILFEDEG
jgi:V/A-type H+-transporting ATPase subunit E